MGHYLSFVALAFIVAVAPGPDSMLTLRSALLGGRRRGLWTTAGICVAGTIQGVLAATGLGAIIAAAEPVFLAIKWIGAAYLAYLGISALIAAWQLRTATLMEDNPTAAPTRAVAAFRTGFLCNITNPKVLAFNLAILPQFVGADAHLGVLLAYALTLTVVGGAVLIAVTYGASAAAHLLRKRRVRQSIEAGSGLVMLGFAGALVREA